MKKWFKRRLPLLMVTAIVLCGGALATEGGSGSGSSSSITSAVTTGLASVQSDALALIGSVIPYALSVMGAVLVISIGLKVFKRITGR